MAAEEVPTPSPDSPESVNSVRKISLKRAEKRVEIDDKPYTIREMTGTQLDLWRSEVGGRVTVDAKGNQRISNFDKFTASLIAKCLYDENDKLVPLVTIANWPATSQKALFEICQEVNGLTEQAGDAIKKD